MSPSKTTKSTTISFGWKLLLGLFTVPPFIQIFFWFNPHHDGLVISTVKATKIAWQTGGQLPFNQYGPFWTIPYSILTWEIPQNWMLNALRVVALTCYLISAVILWKIANRITSRNTSFFLLIIYAASQPFFSGLGMMPWPSSVGMPILGGITLLLLKLIEVEPAESNQASKFAFWIGLLAILLLGTRVQVALILILFILAILFLRKIKKLILFYILGLTSGLALISIYLIHFGSFRQAIFDEFYYGSLYLKQGSVDGYSSKPIYTTAGIITFCIIFSSWKFIISKLRVNEYPKLKSFLAFVLFLLTYGACFMIVYPRNTNLLFAPTIISRRFWSALIISSILFISVSQLKRILKVILTHKNLTYTEWKMLILLGVSLAGITQAWPLFDASHTWWGAMPGIIFVALVLRNQIIANHWKSQSLSRLVASIAALLLLFTATLDIGYFTSSDNRRISHEILANIRADSLTVKNEESVQRIFTSAIPKDSVVLNLCPNSDVYINKLNIQLASRIFVFWPNFSSIQDYMQEIYRSKPEYIVYCSSPAPAQMEAPQKEIVARFTNLNNLVADDTDDYGQRWRIWKVTN